MRNRSKTLPSSPSHSFSSSSSSDFEFRISVSPQKSSPALYRPADELFYKGQLLPLHISPRISMVRNLLSASSASSSTATSTTASRDSSSSTESSSSFTSDLSLLAAGAPCSDNDNPTNTKAKPSKYLSLSRILKKDPHKSVAAAAAPPAKKMSPSVKEVIRKYLMKVKPLFEKKSGGATVARAADSERRSESGSIGGGSTLFSTGSMKCPRMIRRSYVASCPSSMRSSPSHSGVLVRCRISGRVDGSGSCSSDKSTMDELQNAIQGAIAHCKSSNDNKCKVKET